MNENPKISMDSDFHCPKCDGSIRRRTYDEIRSELRDKGTIREEFVDLVMPARMGPFARWWCESCQREFSIYHMLSQVFTATPIEGP
jgi:transposase-like protein